MSTRYINTKVIISDNQTDKIKKAIKEGKDVTIQLSHDDLHIKNPPHILALTKGQLD
jgi:hypothetical protein